MNYHIRYEGIRRKAPDAGIWQAPAGILGTAVFAGAFLQSPAGTALGRMFRMTGEAWYEAAVLACRELLAHS